MTCERCGTPLDADTMTDLRINELDHLRYACRCGRYEAVLDPDGSWTWKQHADFWARWIAPDWQEPT